MKRISSILLVIGLLLSSFTQGVSASTKTENKSQIRLTKKGAFLYEADGFEIKYKFAELYSRSVKGRLTIKNTGDKDLKDWNLKFYHKSRIYPNRDANLNRISRSWYSLSGKNQNRILKKGEEIEIYLISRRRGYNISLPRAYKLSGEFITEDEKEDEKIIDDKPEIDEIEVIKNEEENLEEIELEKKSIYEYVSSKVDLNFKFEKVNRKNFGGIISITNNSDKEIKNWKINFTNYTDIKSISNAKIQKQDDGSYTLIPNEETQSIKKGETLKLKYRSNRKNGYRAVPRNYKLSAVFN